MCDSDNNIAIDNKHSSLFVCGSPDDDHYSIRLMTLKSIGEWLPNLKYTTLSVIYTNKGFRIFHIYDNCAFAHVSISVLMTMSNITHKDISVLIISPTDHTDINKVIEYFRSRCTGVVNMRGGELNTTIFNNHAINNLVC